MSYPKPAPAPNGCKARAALRRLPPPRVVCGCRRLGRRPADTLPPVSSVATACLVSSQKREVDRKLFLSMQREVEEFLEFDVFPRYQAQSSNPVSATPSAKLNQGWVVFPRDQKQWYPLVSQRDAARLSL